MLFGVVAAPTANAATPGDALFVRVLAVNQAMVPDVTLREAERQAARIFSVMGITLVWINVKDNEPYYDPGAHARIIVVSNSRTQRNRRTLGIAHSGNMTAYPFYTRIVAFAEDNSAGVAGLLGHVMAHELGHLLLPSNSHSLRGLMRAQWDREQLDDMAKGLLTFAPDQADLIRTRVRTIAAN